MIPSIENLLIKDTDDIRKALQTIDENVQGICFVVNAEKKLVGTITDGDIRRAILKGISIEEPVSRIMFITFTALPYNSPIELIQKKLSAKITHIPLVDENNVPVDYASINRLHQYQVMEPALDGNELAYVTDCIKTNWISSQGKYVREFERNLADYTQTPYALAVSNGTVALHLALLALDIKEGDEVIVPDLTFAASINAVLYTGATPVIVDIHPDTWTIDPESIKAAITSKTKAIMPVHLYGYPCHMQEIMDIATTHGLYVIEDCAESIGSFYHGKPTGSFGEVASFSFFGNKTITTGEGGMVVFKQKEHYEKATILRDHGMSRQKKYWHDLLGYNYRMTNLQAAVGVAQMERIDEIVAKKIALAELYNQHLKDTEGIQLPPASAQVINSYWLYTILIDESITGITRDELIHKLSYNGIESRPVFYPLHQMPLYQAYGRNAEFTHSSIISNKGISLPSSIKLSEQDILKITNQIKSIFHTRKLADVSTENSR